VIITSSPANALSTGLGSRFLASVTLKAAINQSIGYLAIPIFIG
jgi:hypothetical protein